METKYSNFIAKLLFKKEFENQFFVPKPKNIIEKSFFNFFEKNFFKTKQLDNVDNTIFVFGLPRSGTTLLYNLIAYHQECYYITNSINAYPEAPQTVDFLLKKFNLNIEGERFFKDSMLTDFHSPSEPHCLWPKWFNRTVENLHWQEHSTAFIDETYQMIVEDIAKIKSCFENESRLVIKYPVLFTEMEAVATYFKNPKIIHIVRDPRMVANSLLKLHRSCNEQLDKIKHPMMDSIVPYPRVEGLKDYIEKYGVDSHETTARVWSDCIEIFNKKKKMFSNVLELKYEDLVANPEETMNKVFNFCELAPGDSPKYLKEFASIGKVSHVNKYNNFAEIEKLTKKNASLYGYF